MGQCLRGKMAEAGLVPPLPATETAQAETATPDAPAANLASTEQEPAAEAVTEQPAMDVTPPAEVDADAAADVIAATFGLLRAEPDGSVVIAGSGTPGSEVELFANGEKLGSTTVEQSGDWVFVPDAPLTPGGLEITLGEAGKPGQSEEAFIVVINEDKTTQPLVVASTPGQASEVLQGLVAPVETAAAEPQDPPAAEPPVTDNTEPPAADVAAAENSEPEQPVETQQSAALEAPAEVPEPATEPAAVEPAATAAPEPATAADETPASETATAGGTDSVEPETAVVADVPAETAADAAEPSAATAPAEPVVELATEPAVETALAPAVEPDTTPAPASAPAAAPQDWSAPVIDAIEIEGDRSFFAGSGPDGGVIRLYVDDVYVADATVEGGRWLVEGGAVLTKPSQRIRADLLAPGSADVVARSEVDFVVDLPATAAPVQVADTPAIPEPEPAAETASPAEPVPTSEPTEPAMVSVEPAAEPVEPAAEPVEPAAVPVEAEAPQTSAPSPNEAAAVAPAEPPAAATEPAAPTEPAVEPETAPAAEEPAVPTLVAVSVGDPEAQRFASGKAIIRRGDNLWTIARRVYGEGIKYTTIYEANTGQIRDPDRIYPGQVFSLPTDLTTQ
jgi:nucleoid-associated protein YgaU